MTKASKNLTASTLNGARFLIAIALKRSAEDLTIMARAKSISDAAIESFNSPFITFFSINTSI